MMSVALNDAISLRTGGELVSARHQAIVAAQLLRRLVKSLISFCDSVSVHAPKMGRVPVVEPLNSEFFRGNTAQRAASWSAIVHYVLFSGRAQFFHKLRILSGTMGELDREFSDVASELSGGISVSPTSCWLLLDSLHYDVSTCMRETEIVLKSFLRALPTDQVTSFAFDLDVAPRPEHLRASPSFSRASA
jgi:hypothetical protein